MEEAALIVVVAAIFVWGAVSARLEHADLTAPIIFTAVGAALAGFGLVHASVGAGDAETTGRGHPGVGAVLRRRAGAGARSAR